MSEHVNSGIFEVLGPLRVLITFDGDAFEEGERNIIY